MFLSGVNRWIVEAATNAGMWHDGVTPPFACTDRSEGLKKCLDEQSWWMNSHLFWYLKALFPPQSLEN